MPRQLKIHCDDKRGFERSLERMEVGGGRAGGSPIDSEGVESKYDFK